VRRWRDAACSGLGAAALLTSVLVVGGVQRWTMAIVALLLALALALQWLARRRLDGVSPLVAVLGAAAALTALQLIPLPSGLLELLNATGNGLRDDGATIAQTSPWPSISLDPAATLANLAFFVILLGVALLATRMVGSQGGRFAVLGAVAVVCGLAAIVTAVHTLVSADSLYGLYAPQYSKGGPIFGPLLNPNHMGGLMAIGAVLSLGLAFYHRQAAQLRVTWIVIGVSCVVLVGASLSRGAIIGLVIGLLVTGALLVTSRLSAPKLRRRRLRNDAPIFAVVGLGLAVAMYTSAGGVVEQLGNTATTEWDQPSSKYEAWKSSLELVAETPVVGIGRGATESTLTRVHPRSARWTYGHLENEYLTVLVEWGLLGVLVMGALLVWCAKAAIPRWRDGPLAAAAFGALAAIMFQSGVDFGIELLGLAVPVTMIAATVIQVPLRASGSTTLLRLVRIGMTALLVLAAVVLLLPATRSVREDHELIVADRSSTIADARASIERHPLDYMGFGEGAEMLWRAGNPEAIRFLNHALMLHPTHPGLHRMAAQMLAGAKHYRQAALEYSLAMNAELAPRRMLEDIVATLPNPDDIAAAIPTDYYSVDVMLHALSDLKRDDIAQKWLARVADRPEHDVRIIDKLYDTAMARKDLDGAKAAALLRMKYVHTQTSRVMLAKVQFARTEYDVLLTSLADVAKWTGRIDEKGQAWLILCDVYAAKRMWEDAVKCLHRLDASGSLVARNGILKRLQEINQERVYESRKKAAEAIEKALEKKPKPAPP